MRRAKTEIRTETAVARVCPREDRFEAFTDGKNCETCRTLLVATGGCAFVEGLDHAIEPCVPSLFSLETSDRPFTELAGIVAKGVRASGPGGATGEGDLLITHDGVSGPAVLRLSSFGARALANANYSFDLTIHWRPALREDQVFDALAKCRADTPRRQIGSLSPFGLAARLWKLLLLRAGVEATCEWGRCPLSGMREMARQTTAFSLPILGRSRRREEFVTCGGVRLKEVDFRTMESRRHPGLFLAGETLDMDGLTGGFNLQAAWTTGYLAAAAMLARHG